MPAEANLTEANRHARLSWWNQSLNDVIVIWALAASKNTQIDQLLQQSINTSEQNAVAQGWYSVSRWRWQRKFGYIQQFNIRPSGSQWSLWCVRHTSCGLLFIRSLASYCFSDTLLQISCWAYQWKNFYNRSIFGKDTKKIVLTRSVYIISCHRPVDRRPELTL